MVHIAPLNLFLGAQDLASLAATGGQNGPTGFGGHAVTEAMRLASLPNVRLVSSFHCFLLVRP